MPDLKQVLIVQTAFIGDVVLTLPLIQELKRNRPECLIDIVVIPRCAELLRNHPDIHEIIPYDKRGKDKGISGLLRMAKSLRDRNHDCAFVPHRSMRSAFLVSIAAIPERYGFTTASGKFLYTKLVPYQKDLHEIDRNLEFLRAVGLPFIPKSIPHLFPSNADTAVIDELIEKNNLRGSTMVGIAPGSVWNTKRWLPERFTQLAKNLSDAGRSVIIIGGNEDAALANGILDSVNSPRVISMAGKLSLLQSAELIRRCTVLISNDSAPTHLAVAMRTPVVAIFGATIPGFGFAPIGEHDVVLETLGLNCRPCSIHGGNTCPIKTFVCMKNITVETVTSETQRMIGLKNTK